MNTRTPGSQREKRLIALIWTANAVSFIAAGSANSVPALLVATL